MRLRYPLVAVLLTLAAAGCAPTRVHPYAGQAPRTIPVYVIVIGGHSELALPSPEVSGPLATFRQYFPTARYIVIGWGERPFYMTPHPGLAETLRAALPAPSVLRVAGSGVSPQRAFASRGQVISLQISRPGLRRLQRYIGRYVAIGPNHQPQRLQPAPRAMHVFIASSGTYDVFHTCNTWTAEALHVVGEPIKAADVVLAWQLRNRLPPAGANPTAGG